MKQTSTLVKTSDEPSLLKPHGTGWHSVVHIALTRAPNACSCSGAIGGWVRRLDYSSSIGNINSSFAITVILHRTILLKGRSVCELLINNQRGSLVNALVTSIYQDHNGIL